MKDAFTFEDGEIAASTIKFPDHARFIDSEEYPRNIPAKVLHFIDCVIVIESLMPTRQEQWQLNQSNAIDTFQQRAHTLAPLHPVFQKIVNIINHSDLPINISHTHLSATLISTQILDLNLDQQDFLLEYIVDVQTLNNADDIRMRLDYVVDVLKSDYGLFITNEVLTVKEEIMRMVDFFSIEQFFGESLLSTGSTLQNKTDRNTAISAHSVKLATDFLYLIPMISEEVIMHLETIYKVPDEKDGLIYPEATQARFDVFTELKRYILSFDFKYINYPETSENFNETDLTKEEQEDLREYQRKFIYNNLARNLAYRLHKAAFGHELESLKETL